MAKQVKITVLKRDIYQEFIDEYAKDKDFPVCPKVEDGQVYILDSVGMPENFCSWAWADIHRDVITIWNGGSYDWMKNKNTIITCCTDGLRPVTFKVELISE